MDTEALLKRASGLSFTNSVGRYLRKELVTGLKGNTFPVTLGTKTTLLFEVSVGYGSIYILTLKRHGAKKVKVISGDVSTMIASLEEVSKKLELKVKHIQGDSLYEIHLT